MNKAPADIQRIGRSKPFNKWAECQKAFNAIVPPISESVREQFLTRVRESPHKRFFAFRFLVDRALGDRTTKLAPFETPLLTILSDDQPLLKLEECGSREAIGRAVTEHFKEINSKDSWKKFLNSYEHLWVLYLILRTWHTDTVFTAGVSAFSKSIRQITTAKRKLRADRPESLEHFARTLARKLPEKAILGKSFVDLLSAAQSLVALSAHLADDVVEKSRNIERLSADHGALRVDAETLQTENERLETGLSECKAAIRDLQSKLDQEQEHFDRQKGVNEELRKKMQTDILAELRRACLPRLENIRLFANRDDPNKNGIIRLAQEIEDALGLSDES